MNFDRVKAKVESNAEYMFVQYQYLKQSEQFNPFLVYHDKCLERKGYSNESIKRSFLEGIDLRQRNGLYFNLKKRRNFSPPKTLTSSFNYLDEINTFLNSYIKDVTFHNEYSDLTGFRAFESIEVPKSEQNDFKIMRNSSLYNCKGWSDFLQSLLLLFYPDFQFAARDSKYFFLKKISEGSYLGFGYDVEEFLADVKIGRLDFPETGIFFGSDEELENGSLTQVSSFNNPLAMMLPNLKQYIALSLSKKENGLVKILNPISEKEKGDVKVFSGDEELGLLYKQYLFCFVDYNSQLNNTYLNFYEKILV